MQDIKDLELKILQIKYDYSKLERKHKVHKQ